MGGVKGVDRRLLTLALALTPGIGAKTISRIHTRNDALGRPEGEFLRLSPEALREEYRLTAPAAQSWTQQRNVLVDRAREVLERFEELGIRVVTCADDGYPRRVEELGLDVPAVLYMHGNDKLLTANTFCVLCSRKSSAASLDAIERLAEQGVLAGETLVAGHDTPEYQRSAVVPLRWGAPRILVLDRGFKEAMGETLTDEPFSAARLWRYRFDPATDLVVSPIRPEKTFHPSSNKDRDRIVAGLSSRIDVVVARPGGNMARLASAALLAGRRVRIATCDEDHGELARLGAEVVEV